MIDILEYANSLLPKVILEETNTYELGIDISEKIVAKGIIPFLFGNIKLIVRQKDKRYKGIDIICENNININVKSGILIDNRYIFVLTFYDNASDYFLCFGYDKQRDDNIKILHIWLIDRKEMGIDTTIDKSIRIYNNAESLLKFQKYEKILIDDIRISSYVMENFVGC